MTTATRWLRELVAFALHRGGDEATVAGSHSEEVRPVTEQLKRVIVEVRRRGRRPRYHRAVLDRGLLRTSEQCNTDQAGAGRHTLEALPDGVRLNQLCRRCWRGTPQLANLASANHPGR